MGQSFSGELPLEDLSFFSPVTNPCTRFEAFDEPWKVIYDTPGQAWEDKWGLMDEARNLKPGLKIPDCGGKTAT